MSVLHDDELALRFALGDADVSLGRTLEAGTRGDLALHVRLAL